MQLFRDLLNGHRAMQEKLGLLEGNHVFQQTRYEIQQAKRAEIVDEFRIASRARLKRHWEVEVPAHAETRRQLAQGAMLIIRNGGPFKEPESAEAGFLEDISRQLNIQNAIAIANLQTTETLAARLAEYDRDARGAGDFDFAGWAVLRNVIPQILEARAAPLDAKGLPVDPRAVMALEDLKARGGLEAALLDRMIAEQPGGEPDATAELARTERLIEGAADARGVNELGQFLEIIGRGLDRTEADQAANPQKKPEPKPTAIPFAV